MIEESKILDLFYFNLKEIKPIIFIITRISNEIDEKFLEENTNLLFQTLIDNKLVEENDILIFNLIKDYEGKIINWILPSEKSNKKVLESIENNRDILNNIISTTINKTNCQTLINLSRQELKIKDCDIDLGFFSEIFF